MVAVTNISVNPLGSPQITSKWHFRTPDTKHSSVLIVGVETALIEQWMLRKFYKPNSETGGVQSQWECNTVLQGDVRSTLERKSTRVDCSKGTVQWISSGKRFGFLLIRRNEEAGNRPRWDQWARLFQPSARFIFLEVLSLFLIWVTSFLRAALFIKEQLHWVVFWQNAKNLGNEFPCDIFCSWLLFCNIRE